MPAKAKAKPKSKAGKRRPSQNKVINVRGKDEKEQDQLNELEIREAELIHKEKLLAQKHKELLAEERKLKSLDDELQGRKKFLEGFEEDLMGREKSVKRWMKERDEEWLAQLQGQVELHTRKERHAIVIAVNRYSDERIKDNDHCVQEAREIGVLLEQLNFKCSYLHDDLPDHLLPTRQNIVSFIASLRQVDCVLLVIFIGHVVHGYLTPPRSSPNMRFLLCRNTPLEFAVDNILAVDEVYQLMTENTIDINDNEFKRKGLFIVDGSYMGVTHGCKSEGFCLMQSTTGAHLAAEYKKNNQVLLSASLKKALTGAVNIEGLISCNMLFEYIHNKQSNKRELKTPIWKKGDDSIDFPVANKLLKSRHERNEEKKQQKQRKVNFTLTYTVNQDLDVHNPLLASLVADRLIAHCHTQGEEYDVEIGNMELVGKTELILEGNIHYAIKREKQRLWKEAVESFTGVPSMSYQLVSGESTRQGDEGRAAVVVLIETENEQVVDSMRTNFAKMTHFFGHPCIDLRQHIRCTIVARERQFLQFAKVGYRGQLDDAIFTFTGLRKSLYNIERFNNVDENKMVQLVNSTVPLLIISTYKGPNNSKRNTALGRVADLKHLSGKIRFYYNDILPDQNMPRVQLLPGPNIATQLQGNCVLLLDIKQGRNYVMNAGKSFFQLGFFADSDIRDFCEDFLDGKLEALNHRTNNGNAHPKYRLLA